MLGLIVTDNDWLSAPMLGLVTLLPLFKSVCIQTWRALFTGSLGSPTSLCEQTLCHMRGSMPFSKAISSACVLRDRKSPDDLGGGVQIHDFLDVATKRPSRPEMRQEIYGHEMGKIWAKGWQEMRKRWAGDGLEMGDRETGKKWAGDEGEFLCSWIDA